jgi:hypothetical protein
MKRLSLFLIIFAFVMSASAVYAQQKAFLGIGNVAVKVDYINFTDDDWDDLDVDDYVYVGLEGYANIIENLYIGVEAGWANPDGDVDIYGVNVDTELTYVPIELNLKYAVEPSPNFVFDVGAGASYNYAQVESSAAGTTIVDEDDWLFGGQFFADLTYKFDQFFIGINGKYQITEDFADYDNDFNNWRIGGHIGIMF